jgi:hypothetical protein
MGLSRIDDLGTTPHARQRDRTRFTAILQREDCFNARRQLSGYKQDNLSYKPFS